MQSYSVCHRFSSPIRAEKAVASFTVSVKSSASSAGRRMLDLKYRE